MQEYIIQRNRRILPFPGIWNGLSETGSGTELWHGICFKEYWCDLAEGNYLGFYRKTEWESVGKFVSERILEEPTYLEQIMMAQSEVTAKIQSFIQEKSAAALSTYSFNDLIQAYKKAQKLWISFDQINVLPWFLGSDPLHAYLQRFANEHGITADDFTRLITSPALSFSAEEELRLTIIALALKESSEIDSFVLQKEIDDLVNRFYWIPFGYDGPTIYDAAYYYNTLKSLSNKPGEALNKIKQKYEKYSTFYTGLHQKLISRYSLNQTQWRAFTHLHTLSHMTDERKMQHYPLHVTLSLILEQLSQKLRLPLLDLKQISLEEIITLQNDPGEIISLAAKRRKHCIALFKEGSYTIQMGVEADSTYSTLMGGVNQSNSIQGSVCSKGTLPIVKGIVKILSSSQELEKLHEGEILVTSMTTPEFVPAMRRASAIITDEGGITSHAAIVARELGKPCIINTKNATRFLQDGDTISLNLETGLIFKI